MKNIITLLFLMIFGMFVSINSASAGIYTKNFFAYEIQNVNIRELAVAAKSAINSYNGVDKPKAIVGVNNAYIYSYGDATYFVRVYPANNNTNFLLYLMKHII